MSHSHIYSTLHKAVWFNSPQIGKTSVQTEPRQSPVSRRVGSAHRALSGLRLDARRARCRAGAWSMRDAMQSFTPAGSAVAKT